MNGFEKRARHIREKIIGATLRLLQGPDSKQIRIADIAKAANVSQVTIYNYFGSKKSLLREAFKSYMDKATDEFAEYLNENHTLKEKIEHIILLKKASFRQFSPQFFKYMSFDDQELAQYIENMYRKKTVPLTVRLLQEGKDRGEISAEVSIEHVLLFMQIYINQYDTILKTAQQNGDLDRFMDGMLHLFFYGICGKP
ncbi:MAG TPA: TetR/AcrR family transcriptional regulator [Bacilli bacterium]